MQYLGVIIGCLLIIRGLWGIYRYIQGRSARFYHIPGYDRLKNARNVPWYSRYVNWKASLLWTGSKENASRVERTYLIVHSVLQIIVGVMFLYFI